MTEPETIELETILLVEDDDLARANLEYILKKEGYRVVAASTGARALALIAEQTFDLILTDLKMKQVDGLQVLKAAKNRQPHTEVIVITAYATVDTAVEAMSQGAYHYIPKPFKIDLVRRLVREALLKRRLHRENEHLKETLAQIRELDRPLMVSSSPVMRKIIDILEQVAPSDSNVLIIGETGTGKELTAKTIHKLSRRSQNRFMAFNCGAFTRELLANELFGHEKEAFTGAASTKPGLIEAADKGTVFLDEIGEMPLDMQVKLLRVIEEREVLRVGGVTPIPVDVRFLAATSRDLKRDCEAGRFRTDLYYRLNVVAISLPPLSQRGEDIPLLINFFLDKKSRQIGKHIQSVDPEAMDILVRYPWPGNVRELENVMERSVVMARSDTIRSLDLPEDMLQLSIRTYRPAKGGLPSLEDQEKAYIQWVLEQTSWNKSKAAQILGIDRASLWRKLKRYGLDRQE